MQKRGELTTAQIISLLLTIVGFVAILIFIMLALDLRKQTEDEICRLSVLTRATAPDAAQRFAPLKCKTKKLCLTQNGDCKTFVGEESTNIPLPSNSGQAADKIEETLAESLYTCWNTLGQGKLDLFGGGKDDGILAGIQGASNLFGAKSTCVVCTRIALEEDLSKKTEILNEIKINEYLADEQVPGSPLTYLQAFTDKQISSYPSSFESTFQDLETGRSTDELAIIFMQILTPESYLQAAGETAAYTGGFVLAGPIALGPLGKILFFKARALTTLVASPVMGGIAGFQTYKSRQLSAGYCGEFTSKEKAGEGCSIITLMDYKDISKLNDFCGRIECLQ